MAIYERVNNTAGNRDGSNRVKGSVMMFKDGASH